MSDQPRILTAGDAGLVVEFGSVIDPDVNRRAYEFAAALEAADLDGITELVPTYRSVLVHYDNLAVGHDELRAALEAILRQGTAPSANDQPRAPSLFEIPVAYGGEDGPDLQAVAGHAGLSPDEVVAIHSGRDYRVYMLGFLPGFPYLGGMDERIACPRLKTPRLRVPAGSVGIAESQTGVYPMDSPGGWQLIGRTPAPLFEPAAQPPVAIVPGSFVRFVPTEPAKIAAIEKEIEEGSYRLPSRVRRP